MAMTRMATYTSIGAREPIKIFNLHGQIVYEIHMLETGEAHLPLGPLSTGVYIVRTQGQSRKFIVR